MKPFFKKYKMMTKNKLHKTHNNNLTEQQN